VLRCQATTRCVLAPGWGSTAAREVKSGALGWPPPPSTPRTRNDTQSRPRGSRRPRLWGSASRSSPLIRESRRRIALKTVFLDPGGPHLPGDAADPQLVPQTMTRAPRAAPAAGDGCVGGWGGLRRRVRVPSTSLP
jgi:hypothetical protein